MDNTVTNVTLNPGESGRKEVPPDKEILMWEKWVQIRKEEVETLGKIFARAPVDLEMNMYKDVRADLERKTVLERAQIEKKPTVRGTLFERGPRDRLGDIEIHRTPEDLGRPRVIEHIGVPTYIQQHDLGMSGEPHRNPCSQLNSEYEKYREKREEQLKDKILKIDPFRSSTSKLMVKGNRPRTPPPKIPPLPPIVVKYMTDFNEVAVSEIYAIRINNTVLSKAMRGKTLPHINALENEDWYERCTSWSYYFNVPLKRVGRGKIFLQNLGTVTLKYCWRKINFSLTFIPDDFVEQVFFFNKSEDVLPPGQSRNVCITFVSDRPGIHREYWELFFSDNVNFFNNPHEKILVNLYADSVENIESVNIQVKNLKATIYEQSLYNMANEILRSAFNKAFAKVPQTYPYKKYFLDAQIFVMKNPVCFYHQTEVTKMQETFTKELAPGQTWDLSIGTWRKVLMTKQYEDRMRFYNELKLSHRECVKPWYEGDKLIKEKCRAIKYLLCQLADKLEKEYERVSITYLPKTESEPDATTPTTLSVNTGTNTTKNTEVAPQESVVIDPLTIQMIRNIFYLHAYEHVANTIELCAGVLSSLDSNRWIEFNFCRN